ncbi:sugar transferase [Bacteroidota bacterium]
MIYARWIKSVFDYLSAVTLIIIFSPLVLVVIILLAITQKGQIFFLHRRIGKNEIPFNLIKFRTMMDEADSNGDSEYDEKRITGMGRLIRRFSLDEFPQLINVLKGDMSVIGPRPLLEEYLPLYSDFQKRRHEIKPGITGWAQVNGRNALPWEKRFEHDVYYVDNCSFWLDLKIFFMTFWNILKGEGSFTMEKFAGPKVEEERKIDVERR